MNRAGYIHYKLKLKVLSPLFIGGGEDSILNRLGYVYSPADQKVYMLDNKKWIGFLLQAGLIRDYTDQIKQDLVKEKLSFDNYRYLVSRERLIRKSPAEVLEQVATRTLSVKGLEDFKNNDIHLFIRNAEGNPYIPGSSIKGALRTALMSGCCQQNRTLADKHIAQIEGILNNPNSKFKQCLKELASISGRAEAEVFDYRSADGEAVINGMSGILVSDSTPFSNGDLYLERKRDLVYADGKIKRMKRISLYREYAKPGTEAEFTLIIDTWKVKKELRIEGIADIIKALESRWQTLFGGGSLMSAWRGIEEYLPKEALANDRTGLMLLGGGAGYHSKSVITSLSKDVNRVNSSVRKIMNMRFLNKGHLKDQPFSPRALKVASFGGRQQIIGICRISVV